ncbi:MAG: isopentenyl-diphosphate Delta-isomerase [Candidatus Caccovivens sp.]
MLRNEIVCVDVFDNELETITKNQAHSKPILHRAFSVFLINDKKEILIQKRADNKYHSGGLWANACCSHPKSQESVVISAEHRLMEELNISTTLQELFSFIYLHKFNDNLYEYELDHVLLGEYSGEVELNLEEASAYRWISIDALAQELLNEPQKFASWFLICAPRVLKYLLNS